MSILAAGTVDGVEYTLPLAIFDAVPVVLAGIAYLWASRELTTDQARRKVALVGTLLVVLGGSVKVIWKIVIAANGTDIAWLDDLMWPLLSAGLPLLGGALSSRVHVRTTVALVVVVQGVLLALWLGTGLGAARGLAIAVMTLSTIWIAVGLISRARRWDVGRAVPLVVANVSVAFILSGLARMEQTIALQWIEEVLNAGAQGALLVAVALLVRGRAEARPGATSADTSELVPR
jgi:hypothetical protein